MLKLKKSRFDYFLIWGHGVRYQKEIQEIINNEPHFQVTKVIDYEIKNISKFIKKIYSYDYAPFFHLKNKTKYLKQTPPKIRIIIVKNNFPVETYYGEGSFLHIECERVKRIKETIRNQFNERKLDRRTENHVIHASDNEKQTDYLLKFLGYKTGIEIFRKNSNRIINAPYHLFIPNSYLIKTINIDELYCSIIVNDRIRVVSLDKSPQYSGGNQYTEYLKKYNGKYLQDGYSIEKYNLLQKNLRYLQGKYKNDYIIIKNDGSKFIIIDGLHRAAILKKREVKTLKAIIV